jgi:hypothetical protein
VQDGVASGPGEGGSTVTIADILEAADGQTLGESLSAVITALKGESLVVPLGGEPNADGTLQMMFANDKEGRAWLYVYTSPEELAAANMGALTAHWIAFDQIVSAVNAPGYGGIFIDAHKPRGAYLIPAEYFADIVAYLAE